MKKYSIIIDTNVVLAALRSRRGASFKLISMIDQQKYVHHLSVPLVLEYESIISRQLGSITLNGEDIDIFLDFLCTNGRKFDIHYLWRPYLKDPKDDFVLELAVTSESDFIITYNFSDFKGIDKFGLKAIAPKEFLKMLES